MPEYRYNATDMSGKIIKGKVTFNNPDQLKRMISDKGLILVDFTEAADKEKTKRLKSGELAEFCRELSSMLSSGVSLVRALNIISNRDMKPRLKNAFSELNSQIKRGIALSDAMEMQGQKFPMLLINMVKVGEATGRLDDTMDKMAAYFEKEKRLNGSIKSALTYPIILAVLTLLVVVILFTFVIPTFTSVFDGMEIPKITEIMLGISNFFTHHYFIALGVVLAIAAVIYILRKNEKFRFWFDKKKLKFPKIGKLLKIIYTARFSRTLASLYSSGLTIINSLQIAKDTIGNRYITSQFDEVIKNVRAGNQLSTTLMTVDGFDKKLAQTIAVGEETGQLDTLLVSTADSFDYESEMATKQLIQFIEPVMIVIMAVIVCVVMLSVMLPIFGMYSQIEQQGEMATMIKLDTANLFGFII